MSGKTKVIKRLKIFVCISLVLIIIVAGFLFFPLTGKKHSHIWSPGDRFDISEIQTVRKEQETFKILMFTDTQFWFDIIKNQECFDEMDALVERTNPDLIVLPGDNLSGFSSRFSIDGFIKHIDSYQTPWAPVFGNHDSEIPTISRNWQADKYIQSEYCIMEKGPSNLYGCGNYVINITENETPVYSLFFFDNGEYIKYDDGRTKEVYMDYAQIAWYEWNVKNIAAASDRIVPSMTFSHFAQPEFHEAVEKYGVKNEDGSYTIPEEYGFGRCAYLPSAAPVNSGFIERCKALGSTKYVFCGHDHENNASITLDGITYTYGLKTGPSPAPWNFADQTGGTLITISGKGENQTVNIKHVVIE